MIDAVFLFDTGNGRESNACRDETSEVEHHRGILDDAATRLDPALEGSG
jgi:hypothetical protein